MTQQQPFAARRRRRSPIVPVHGIEEAVTALDEVGAATVILDVEPMIARWHAPAEVYIDGACAFLDAIADGAPGVSAVVIASNSSRARPPVAAAVPVALRVAAGKPWRTDYLRGISRPVAVIGDQVLTDGLLALRLRGVFLHWHHDLPVPWWPRLQRLAGRFVRPLAFERRGNR